MYPVSRVSFDLPRKIWNRRIELGDSAPRVFSNKDLHPKFLGTTLDELTSNVTLNCNTGFPSEWKPELESHILMNVSAELVSHILIMNFPRISQEVGLEMNFFSEFRPLITSLDYTYVYPIQ